MTPGRRSHKSTNLNSSGVNFFFPAGFPGRFGGVFTLLAFSSASDLWKAKEFNNAAESFPFSFGFAFGFLFASGFLVMAAFLTGFSNSSSSSSSESSATFFVVFLVCRGLVTLFLVTLASSSSSSPFFVLLNVLVGLVVFVSSFFLFSSTFFSINFCISSDLSFNSTLVDGLGVFSFCFVPSIKSTIFSFGLGGDFRQPKFSKDVDRTGDLGNGVPGLFSFFSTFSFTDLDRVGEVLGGGVDFKGGVDFNSSSCSFGLAISRGLSLINSGGRSE